MKTIKIQGKKVAEIYMSYGDCSLINNPDKFSASLITEEIANITSDIGFGNREELINFVRDFILGDSKEKPCELEYHERKIMEVIKKTLSHCLSVFEEEVIKIFIFPTIDDFSINKMGGVNGFCVSQNVMFIGLFPTKGWGEDLMKTIAHELAHALSPSYDMEKMTLGEGLIFEGVAEHFREKFIGGKQSSWSSAISRNEAREIFNQLKKELDHGEIKLYTEVFYGTGKYPLWSGYTIGYYILEDYLKKLNKIDWRKIISANPKKILKESGWL